MTIIRDNLTSDATWQREWQVADNTEKNALIATYLTPLGPKRGDVIFQLDITTYYLFIGGGNIVQINHLVPDPVNLTTQVSGILPIANGGTGVNNFYAEGDWTPVITFGGGITGITYGANTGKYVRIGRFVALTGLIILTSKGSSTGNALVAGLPFTIGNANGFISAMKVGYSAFAIGVQEVGLQGITNSTTLNTVKSVAGTNTIMTDVDYTNTSVIVPYFCYMV